MPSANAAAFDKTETIAYRLYLADFQLNQPTDAEPKEWYELDADDKFGWLYLAEAAVREMSFIPDDIMSSVVEAYRNRPLFPIKDGDTWEGNISDFFVYGWYTIFEQFGQPQFPKKD